MHGFSFFFSLSYWLEWVREDMVVNSWILKTRTIFLEKLGQLKRYHVSPGVLKLGRVLKLGQLLKKK